MNGLFHWGSETECGSFLEQGLNWAYSFGHVRQKIAVIAETTE